MTTYELLRQAVLKRQQVTAVYKGRPREFCPHALGAKGGVRHCLGYQFAGESTTAPIVPGSPDNWRCFVVEELSEVVVRDGPWWTAPNWDRRQTCVDVIDVEVLGSSSGPSF